MKPEKLRSSALLFCLSVLMIVFLYVPAFGGLEEDISEMQKQEAETAAKLQSAMKERGYQIDTGAINMNSGGLPDVQNMLRSASSGGENNSEPGYMSSLYWFFIVFLSIVGFGYFNVGKRNGDFYFMASGIIMMVYPYFVTGTLTLVLIGIALTVLPFLMSMGR